MKLFKRGHAKLERLRAASRLQEAIGRAEAGPGQPEPSAPEPPQPEIPRERVLCYSPSGGFAHDDTGDVVPRPACNGGARRYERAVSPDAKRRAAALKPCPHCAERRESSGTEAAS